MDMLNNATNSNTEYSGLTENSTDMERLDVLFRILLNDYPTPTSIDNWRLKIPLGKEANFESLLYSTNLVEELNSNKHQKSYKLKLPVISILNQYDSFSSYQLVQLNEKKSKDAAIEEKENLTMQKLKSDNLKLTQELIDYPKVKKQRNILFVISVVSLLVAIIAVIVKAKSK